MFTRIVDLNNFEIVLKELTPFEAGCLYSRVGWLHIYNPCKPEVPVAPPHLPTLILTLTLTQGSYELDLSHREERVVAKTLCVLATNEPGDNWPFQQFRWNRAADPMPVHTHTYMYIYIVSPTPPYCVRHRYRHNRGGS